MARRTTSVNKAFELIRNLIEVRSLGRDQQLIVNGTMLKSILSTIQPDTLNKALEKAVTSQPAETELPTHAWVKAARDRTGLSQRKFSELVSRKGIKVSGSDIGNLEIGYRLINYTPKRLDEIKNAIRLTIQDLEDPNKEPATS